MRLPAWSGSLLSPAIVIIINEPCQYHFIFLFVYNYIYVRKTHSACIVSVVNETFLVVDCEWKLCRVEKKSKGKLWVLGCFFSLSSRFSRSEREHVVTLSNNSKNTTNSPYTRAVDKNFKHRPRELKCKVNWWNETREFSRTYKNVITQFGCCWSLWIWWWLLKSKRFTSISLGQQSSINKLKAQT